MMLKPITNFLERLAQRCLALAASMFASTFETLHLKYEAEQQSRLEELARTYEADGMPEIAKSLRERVRGVSFNDPAAHGEALLRQFTQTPVPVLENQGSDSTSTTPQSLPAPSRRTNGPAKRAKTPSAPPDTTAQSPPNDDVFFPLNSDSNTATEETR